MKYFLKRYLLSPILSFYRRLFLRKKIALGEKKWYKLQFKFLCIDINDSDYDIDFEKNTFSKNFNNIKNIYTAHTLEHISEGQVKKILIDCYNSLSSNGTLRIEVPDCDLITNDYNNKREYINEIALQNKINLVQELGFKDIYSKPYMAYISTISCYVDYDIWKGGIHIPVLIDEDEFNQKLKKLNKEKFYDWLISKQTLEQRRTNGHITWYNYTKLEKLLKEAGFEKIFRCQPKVSFNNFDLTLERANDLRTKYSLIVEATK